MCGPCWRCGENNKVSEVKGKNKGSREDVVTEMLRSLIINAKKRMRVTATCRRIPRRHSTCRSRPGRPVGLAPSRPTASSNHLDISIKSANAKCPSRKSSIMCHYLYLHTWSNHLEASAPIGAWMCNFLQPGKINQNILARLSCPFFWKLWQKTRAENRTRI